MVSCTRPLPALRNFTCAAVCADYVPPPAFNRTAVLLHNSLGWGVVHTVRLVVNRTDLVVTADGGGAVLPSQVNALPAAAVEALPSAAGIPGTSTD